MKNFTTLLWITLLSYSTLMGVELANVHRGLELKGTLNRKDFGLSFGLGEISVGKEVSLDLILEKS